MGLILLVCAVSTAWLVVVLTWARRQRIDLGSNVSDIERALEAQEEAIKELGKVSEDFSESVENALRKLGAEDNLESDETTQAVDPINEPTIEFEHFRGSWKIPSNLVIHHLVTRDWPQAKSDIFIKDIKLAEMTGREAVNLLRKEFAIRKKLTIGGLVESVAQGVGEPRRVVYFGAVGEPSSVKTPEIQISQMSRKFFSESTWIESLYSSRRSTWTKAARKRDLVLEN